VKQENKIGLRLWWVFKWVYLIISTGFYLGRCPGVLTVARQKGHLICKSFCSNNFQKEIKLVTQKPKHILLFNRIMSTVTARQTGLQW